MYTVRLPLSEQNKIKSAATLTSVFTAKYDVFVALVRLKMINIAFVVKLNNDIITAEKKPDPSFRGAL